MLQKAALSILLALAVSSIQAQSIQGVVQDENGNRLSGAHVQIKEINSTTITDTAGTFSFDIKDIDSNMVTLRVTYVGFQFARKRFDVPNSGKKNVKIILKKAVYESETMVVTATRTRRDLEEVSTPVTVISDKEIQQSGSMRLSDILSEQTGMQIVNDHGTGIQMQGFDPDYTLVMIDGSPVIGRTAGTLDLSRLSVSNVKQIEIVKGPSSVLWGSDALAGVVNIITSQKSEPFSAGFKTRYGQHNKLDLSGDLSISTNNWNNDFFINRNSSTGYKLNSTSVSQTVPEYENYTLSYKTTADISEDFTFDGNIRYFTESQTNQTLITNDSGTEQHLSTDDAQRDFLIEPSVTYTPNNQLNVTASWLYTNFIQKNKSWFQDSGDLYESSSFNQYYHKPEIETDFRWNDAHHSVAGVGSIFERLVADRYPSQPDFTTKFLFMQHSWTPVQDYELTGGLRFDSHSEYNSQLSPKISSRYKLNNWIQFRASVGRGFKAPEFRQLFLDFTNATAGYSVFGSSTVEEGLEDLKQQGQIDQILIPLEDLDNIKAESSWAANAGVDVDPIEWLRIRVNLFRNNVTDLIETAPIAQKTNGQNVFTYFNINKVFTQGIETEVRVQLNKNFNGSLGYQLLDANRRIERDRTVQNDQGEIVEVTEVSYEPMFNRSQHSGNVKLFYENDTGWGANIRGTLRGKYGRFDSNGNGFVDQNEYEDAYMIWNAAVSKRFDNGITIQTGLDNAFGYTNSNQPNFSGRRWYAQVSIEF